jgi:hypothetical protein
MLRLNWKARVQIYLHSFMNKKYWILYISIYVYILTFSVSRKNLNSSSTHTTVRVLFSKYYIQQQLISSLMMDQ